MTLPRNSPVPKAPKSPTSWSKLLHARGEWAFVIVTAALTSAGVSLLTTWLTSPRNAAPDEWVEAVTVEYEPLEPVEAAELTDTAGTDDEIVGQPDAAPASEPAAPVAANRRPAAKARRNAPATARRSGTAATTTPTPSPPPRPGRLAIVTVPDGANVTINGVGYGITPLTISYLPPGERRVRVTKSGYQTEERVLRNETPPSLRIVLRETAGSGGAQ